MIIKLARPSTCMRYFPSRARVDGYRDRDGGGRDRDSGGRGPAPRSTDYRVIVTNLHPATSWQDLKDFGRQVGQVLYAAVRPDDRHGSVGVIEFGSSDDMRVALRELDGVRIRGMCVYVISVTSSTCRNGR